MTKYRSHIVALLGGTILSGSSLAQDMSTIEVAIPQPTQDLSEPNGPVSVQNSSVGNATLTKQALNQLPGSSNYLQAIKNLPGVNLSSKDPSGLYGGAISVRGLDSTQLNFVVNGVSQSDPGTGVILPQISIDKENICSINLQQGTANSAEGRAPLGSVGGVISISSCAPADQFGVAYSQSAGQFGMTREFARLDTGKFGEGAKGFISFSNTDTDIFYGAGSANRQHIDSQFVLDTSENNKITLDAFWTLQNQTTLRQLTLAQFNTYGAEGYGRTPPGTLIGTKGQIAALAVSPSALTTLPKDLYYKSFNNPGIWYGGSIKDELKLSDNVTLTIQPYYWYQYSGSSSSYANYNLTGGFGKNPLTGQTIGKIDDSNKFALVEAFSDSLINRAGANTSVAWHLEDQTITAGVGLDVVRQRQFLPYQRIRADGTVADQWFLSANDLRTVDGQRATGRDWLTETFTAAPFLLDEIKLLDGRLTINPSIQVPITERDFTNNPATNTAAFLWYKVKRNWTGATPALSAKYDFDPANSAFASMARGFEIPTNSIDGFLVNPSTGLVNYLGPVKAEVSHDYELGYRYKSEDFSAALTLYHTDFYNRISLIPNTSGGFSVSSWANVGSTTTNGAELTTNLKIADGLNLFTSTAYNDSRMNDNVRSAPDAAGKTVVYDTIGKIYYNSPRWLASVGLVYQVGAATFEISSKYTDRVYTTLVNDQWLNGYNIVDIGFSYDLKKDTAFQDLTSSVQGAVFSFNIGNLFNKKYLQPPSSGNTGALINAAGNPTYLVGNPFYVSGRLAVNF